MKMKIKVVTYNICHGMGNDGKVSLLRTAETLQPFDADIIALQEVDSRMYRSSFQHQTQVLARHLGMNSVFAPNLHFLGKSAYGNAVLSRYPIAKQVNVPLPGGSEQRGLQHCVLDIPGSDIRKISFFNTHLGLSSKERMQQTKTIAEALGRTPYPVLLAGDFNCSPDAPELRALASLVRYPQVCLVKTYPAITPRYPIDQIYHSNEWEALEMSAYPSNASDHLPLVCILKLCTS